MLNVTAIGAIIWGERKALGLRFLVELERRKRTVQMGKALDVLAALGCELQILGPDGAAIVPHPSVNAASSGE